VDTSEHKWKLLDTNGNKWTMLTQVNLGGHKWRLVKQVDTRGRGCHGSLKKEIYFSVDSK
jgi:hypothetical protein